MKKLIDRFIEWLYEKRFPERCGRFPLPDILEINRKRLSVVKLCSEESWEKQYYPFDIVNEVDLKRYFIGQMKDNIVKHLKIESINVLEEN